MFTETEESTLHIFWKMYGLNKESKQKYQDYFSSDWVPSGKHAVWANMHLNQNHSRVDWFLNRVLITE